MEEDIYVRAYYDFLVANGFDASKYSRILETGAHPNRAISRYIEGPDSFILDERIDYEDLGRFKFFGGNGIIDENGFILSRNNNGEFDSYFRIPLQTKKSPHIDDFDAILSPIDYRYLYFLLAYKNDLFIGSVVNHFEREKVLHQLRVVERVFEKFERDYKFETKNLDQGKQIILVKANRI